MKNLIVLFIVAIALGGCASTKLAYKLGKFNGKIGTVAQYAPPSSLKPICKALGPKIRFNTINKDSTLHAGSKLAPRLSQQNDVRDGLKCK